MTDKPRLDAVRPSIKLGLVALLLAAPLAAQDTVPVVTPGWTGTTCRGTIIHQQFVLRWPQPYDFRWWVEYDALMAHEKQHVVQMSRFAACPALEAALLANRDSVLLDLEAEASCAQLAVFDKARWNTRDLVGLFVIHLKAKLSDSVPIPAVHAALTKHCPALTGD